MNEEPFKVCSNCGAHLTLERWQTLAYVGVQRGIDSVPPAELRNCDCGSTISVPINSENTNNARIK